MTNSFNEAFYYGKKEKKTDAQDDNTLPTLKSKPTRTDKCLKKKKKEKVKNLTPPRPPPKK